MSYVELRAKSNFSFLTGASHPEELFRQAADTGLSGLAITDLNGVYGMPKGYKAVRGLPSFKLLVGSELTFFDHPNLTLIATNRASYGFLCRIITQSKVGKEKGEGNLYLDDFLQRISSERDKQFIALPRMDKKCDLSKLKSVFNENIYLPLTFYLDGRDKKRVSTLVGHSKKFEIPLVATNDVEYHLKERKVVQDVLVSVRETKSLEKVGFKLRSNAERYIKSFSQMQRLYSDFPNALELTTQIANACSFCPSELKYRYPSEWIPEQFNAQSYLEFLVWKLAPHRYPNGMSDKVRAQLTHELKLISELMYADYFLTIYDIVDFARKREILCQGRGSAANSVVCYALGITAIDPIQMNLLFERFISAERGEPPDIDIDFEHERREEVIQYIYARYGRDRAGMVSAVVTYQFRSALREVSKAFSVPVGTLSAKEVERNFDSLVSKLPDKENLRKKIDTVASELQGFPRHLSIHSGGFTLSADPIVEIVPIEPARMENRTIIQWDKYDLDILGLIKVDVLSLGMLSCLRKTLELTNLKLHEIPHDDKPTYEMIQQCDTIGTFQIESRAQMSMLGRLKPENFYDLVVEVAIVRPGPIVGKMIHPYLKRRKGIEKITYPNAIVENILGKTLGVPLFQEQIMKLAIELAQFSPGEADLLRKSINAWRTSAPIGVMAERLRKGLLDNGMTPEFAKQIFEQIQGFSHYGFPESHAASFALIAYASCYLKCHYPAEFAASLVNSQPMGFYRNDTILYDAIRHGVEVLPVSVLQSDWDCTIEDKNKIRLGFRVVKGISKVNVIELIEERSKSEFLNLADFLKRTSIRSDVLNRFALAGRFSEFNWDARDSLWAIVEYDNLFKEKHPEQLNLFRDSDTNVEATSTQDFKALTSFEKIQSDYRAFSLSNHGHPMQEMRRLNSSIPKMTSKTIRTLPSGRKISVSGLVLVRQKPPTANGVVFSTLEDEFGFIDLVFWNNVYTKYKEVILNNCFITISGKLQKDGNTVSVLVEAVRPVWDLKPGPQSALNIEPDQYFYS